MLNAFQAEKIRTKAERETIRAAELEARNKRDAALRAELDSQRASSRGLPDPAEEANRKEMSPSKKSRSKSPVKKGGKKK